MHFSSLPNRLSRFAHCVARLTGQQSPRKLLQPRVERSVHHEYQSCRHGAERWHLSAMIGGGRHTSRRLRGKLRGIRSSALGCLPASLDRSDHRSRDQAVLEMAANPRCRELYGAVDERRLARSVPAGYEICAAFNIRSHTGLYRALYLT